MKMQYSSLEEVSSPDPTVNALAAAKAKAAKLHDEVKEAQIVLAEAMAKQEAKQREAKAADDEFIRLEKEALRYDIWQQERLQFLSCHRCRGTKLL